MHLAPQENHSCQDGPSWRRSRVRWNKVRSVMCFRGGTGLRGCWSGRLREQQSLAGRAHEGTVCKEEQKGANVSLVLKLCPPQPPRPPVREKESGPPSPTPLPSWGLVGRPRFCHAAQPHPGLSISLPIVGWGSGWGETQRAASTPQPWIQAMRPRGGQTEAEAGPGRRGQPRDGAWGGGRDTLCLSVPGDNTQLGAIGRTSTRLALPSEA